MTQELIPLELIDPNPWQTRLTEDPAHVDELAHDIKAIGMMQTPSARKVGERYQLAFGHNRLAAYKLLNTLGWETFDRFPLNIHELDDEQMAIAAFSENEKRQDLNPVEKAMAISKMINDFSWTQQQVAEKLHIDRSGVSNSLRMLRMPTRVLDCIAKGSMPVRSALALLPIYDFTDEDVMNLYSKYSFDLAEFEALAMNGEINSDSIRGAVEKYSNFLHPEQLQLIDVPATVVESDLITAAEEVAPGIEQPAVISTVPMATQAEIPTWIDPGENEEQDEPEINLQETGPLSGEGSGQGTEPGTPSNEVPQVPQIEPKQAANHQPSVAVQVADAQVAEAVDPNEILFTITYKTAGVYVGVRKPGAVPVIRFLEHLRPAEVPALMKEMGIG